MTDREALSLSLSFLRSRRDELTEMVRLLEQHLARDVPAKPPEPQVPIDPRLRQLVADGNDLPTIFWKMGRALTEEELSYCRQMKVPGSELLPATAGQPGQDRRAIRDLSEINGPAIVEGQAGHVDYITVRRPAGERVKITMSRTTSNYGAITDAQISARGEVARGSGSDCFGEINFTATGDDQVRVELLASGALAVQRNQGV